MEEKLKEYYKYLKEQSENNKLSLSDKVAYRILEEKFKELFGEVLNTSKTLKGDSDGKM